MTWDDRWWSFSLKTDKPMETYQKLISDDNSDEAERIDQLPPERQKWYRA